MDGITSAELARRAHVSRSAITQARTKGLILQDEDGTFDPNSPDVALYIQRGCERSTQKKGNESEPKPKKQTPNNKKKNEEIFIQILISVLSEELGEKKQNEIMGKLFNKYKEAIS